MSDSSGRPPSLVTLPSYLASKAAAYGLRHFEAVLTQHSLGLGHHAVLTALDDFGPLSQQQLADSLDLDKSHLVSRIDHLEEHGLVTRTPDRTDRRRHRVVLTSAGKTLIDELRPAAEESQQKFLSALSATERETLTSLLRRVLDANDAEQAARRRPDNA